MTAAAGCSPESSSCIERQGAALETERGPDAPALALDVALRHPQIFRQRDVGARVELGQHLRRLLQVLRARAGQLRSCRDPHLCIAGLETQPIVGIVFEQLRCRRGKRREDLGAIATVRRLREPRLQVEPRALQLRQRARMQIFSDRS